MFCHHCGLKLTLLDLFCGRCGSRVKQVDVMDLENIHEIITYYFLRGYTYKNICMYLAKYHNITLSLRTLKRHLKEYDLKKSSINVSEDVIKEIITKESSGPAALLGYRGWWNRLRLKYGILAPRNTIMTILRRMNPARSAERKGRKLSKI